MIYSYARVSTAGQSKDGNSLEDQTKALLAYGCQEIITEAFSGKSIVIPFNGRFRNQATEIKNYGAYLSENCGGAILKWVIAGAQKYIQNEYKLIIPEAIREATQNYHAENDWAADFFSKCLIFETGLSATGSELYSAYTAYCQRCCIAPFSSAKVMPRIAEHYGVIKRRTNRGTFYDGVGVSKPSSLIFLLARAGECRGEGSDGSWDNLLPD